MTTGIIYCRVSSKEQVEGTSLEVQEAACRDYARQNNISVLRVFIEHGESAKFADRTQLMELIEYCRENKNRVNALIVWKLDRFARNVADHYSIKATLAKYGVRIASVTEPIGSKPEGKLMETILAGFAAFDNDLRAMRTVQGMRRKLQEGIFPWGPPYGYRSVVVGDEKKTRPDVPDPVVFPLLQRAWREFATGVYTQAEMRRMMGAWGLTTARKRAFSPQTINQMFTNRYYAGILVDPWNGEEYVGKHVPLVTHEEFARVQTAIKKRNRSLPHQKVRPEFPLRGLIRCQSCHNYLTASISRGHGGRYPYYHCRVKACRQYGKSVPVSDAHSEFAEVLEHLSMKENLLERLGEKLLAAIQRRHDNHRAVQKRQKDRAVCLDRELHELIRMRAQGLITDHEFLHQKQFIIRQRDSIRSTQEKLPAVEDLRKRLDQITLPLVRLRETWESLAPKLQQRFQHLLLPAGFVHGQVGTAQTGRLFNAFSNIAASDSSEVPLTYDSWNQIIHEIQALHNIFEERNRFTNECPLAV